MKTALLALPILIAAAGPAHATGGFTCRTTGAPAIEIGLGFGHAPGAPLVLARLVDSGRQVPVTAPQWWLDSNELRLLLASPDAMRRELILKAKKNGRFYDGSIWRGGKRRWVRCRES
jgi:hypothetical protein